MNFNIKYKLKAFFTGALYIGVPVLAVIGIINIVPIKWILITAIAFGVIGLCYNLGEAILLDKEIKQRFKE